MGTAGLGFMGDVGEVARGIPSGASPSGLSSCPAPPRLRLPLRRLLHAGLLAARPPAPALCARRRAQFLPVHRPLLLLSVGSWPVLKGKAEGQDRAPQSHLHLGSLLNNIKSYGTVY